MAPCFVAMRRIDGPKISLVTSVDCEDGEGERKGE
uniref:Uncharacterized protein n=1 Tax=Arundo donax TaxID=35708 RepID=A0A0A9AU07_ARUDO